MQPDPVDEAWQRVLEGWDEDDRHRRFLQLCMTLDRLPDAGRRYQAAKEDPARRPVAERQVSRLVALATERLRALRTPPPTGRNPKVLVLAFGVTMGLIAAALWSWLGAG